MGLHSEYPELMGVHSEDPERAIMNKSSQLCLLKQELTHSSLLDGRRRRYLDHLLLTTAPLQHASTRFLLLDHLALVSALACLLHPRSACLGLVAEHLGTRVLSFLLVNVPMSTRLFLNTLPLHFMYNWWYRCLSIFFASR